MRVTGISEDNIEFFEDLAPDGALKDRDIFWLGAIAGDGTACAVLGAGVYGGMAYIDWIYTDPDYRTEGAAGSLLRSLRALLRKIDVEMLQISYKYDDENVEEFLEAEGFLSDDDNDIYSIPVKELMYSEILDAFDERHTSGARVVTPASLEKPGLFYDYLQKNGIPYAEENDDLSQSLIRIDGNGDIDGCMLISRRPDGDLEISYLLNTGPDSGVIDIFSAFTDLAVRMDWQEDNIIFTDRSGDITRFIEELTGTDCDPYILTGHKVGIATV
ncbi:MAG: hypothetical protein K6E90_06955 [Lachnospiraceae bacterium]|nr:hypothetical protein [Lachnospiraceae bacterium]